MPYLEVLNGPEVGKKAPLTQDTFFLGRDANNHLVLSDRTVSRKHAVINQLEGQFVISDLKSLKGLLINGSKMGEAILEDGDEIALGAVRIRFHLTEARVIPFPGQKKRSRRSLWMGGIFLVLILVGGGLYYFKPSFNLSSFHKIPAHLEEMESHYRRGVELFNGPHDTQGAKKEWEKVLELDPNKTTPFGKKASKLLDSVSRK